MNFFHTAYTFTQLFFFKNCIFNIPFCYRSENQHFTFSTFLHIFILHGFFTQNKAKTC